MVDPGLHQELPRQAQLVNPAGQASSAIFLEEPQDILPASLDPPVARDEDSLTAVFGDSQDPTLPDSPYSADLKDESTGQRDHPALKE